MPAAKKGRSTKAATAESTAAPAAKKGRGRKAAPATEPDEDEDEAEATEEATPAKRTRAPKTYTVAEDMAEAANEFLNDDSEDLEDGDDLTPAIIYELRENGMKWDGNEENPGIKFVAGIKSAIPLRAIYHKYQAEVEEDAQIEATAANIVEARDEQGMGWAQIAGKAGITVPEAKALYTEGGGDLESGGRPYGKGDSVRHVTAADLQAAKASNGEEDAEDEEDEEEGDEAEAEAPAEETPAPRRRRQRAK